LITFLLARARARAREGAATRLQIGCRPLRKAARPRSAPTHEALLSTST
jgi:hypothetical protein